MLVREIMKPNPVTLKQGNSLGYAARLFRENGVSIIPVVEGEQHLCGVLTIEKFLAVISEGRNLGESIGAYMEKKDFVSVYEDEEMDVFLELGTQRAPVTNRRNSVTGVITEKELAEGFFCELQDVFQASEAIIGALCDGIVVLDRNGVILRTNSAAENLLAPVVRGQLPGRKIDEILPLPISIWLETGKAVSNQKYFIDELEFLISFLPLSHGKRDHAILLFQYSKEIEKLSHELHLFKELKEELDAVIESSYDGIYITDGDGVTLRINKACERIEGVTAEDVIGKNMKELVEKGFYSESVTLKVLEQKKPVTLIQKVKNGKEVIATGNPVFKNGELFRVVTNSRDITDLNNLQRQLLETRKLSEQYQSEVEHLRLQQLKLENIVANSSQMRRVVQQAVQVAEVDTTVLILGESGVGKEIVTKIIHTASKRSKGPFIKINCGAIPENLLESELFGYVKGAFTGANKEGKMGLFELAHKGTIFLDEIADVPPNLQVKLLRVLQEREIYKIGADKPVSVDVRIIAATNRDLQAMVLKNLFRADLFYRINVVPVLIPPLRERKDDIQPLVIHFLNRFNRKYSLSKSISPQAIDCLVAYDWPGNIRELENMIERLVVTSHESIIDVNSLPEFIKEAANKRIAGSLEQGLSLKDALEKLEKQILQNSMQLCKDTQEMADMLGVDRTTITRKLKKYSIPNLYR